MNRSSIAILSLLLISHLVSAKISIDWKEHISLSFDDIEANFNVIKERVSRKRLCVVATSNFLHHMQIVYCSNIQFSRLIQHKIFPFDSDWMDSLVPLLENTPRLKSLVVDYRSTHRPPIASATWSQRGYYPECLYSSLEKFELVDYGGREEEEELVEYILRTSRCLKTATIYLKSTLEPEIKDTMMKKSLQLCIGFLKHVSFDQNRVCK